MMQPRRLITGVVAMTLLVANALAAAATKDDVVEFGKNRLIGEIKRMERGVLSFKTDPTDTIGIHWEDVVGLVSAEQFRVMRSDGHLYFGSLVPSTAPGTVTVVGANATTVVPMRDVVSINKVENTIGDRLDINTSVGYSFSKASEVETFNFGASIRYETERVSRSLNLTSQASSADSVESSTRNTAMYQSARLLEDRWFAGWLAGFENNDELDLRFRLTLAAIGGRAYYPTPEIRLRAFGGLGFNEEEYQQSDPRSSAEGVFGGTVDWFRFRDPEFDLSTNLLITPSITEQGRVRSHLDITLRWELYEDLFWQVSTYGDYDNKPPNTNGDSNPSSSDYGVSTGLGWSW
jgi:hypothetical protein